MRSGPRCGGWTVRRRCGSPTARSSSVRARRLRRSGPSSSGVGWDGDGDSPARTVVDPTHQVSRINHTQRAVSPSAGPCWSSRPSAGCRRGSPRGCRWTARAGRRRRGRACSAADVADAVGGDLAGAGGADPLAADPHPAGGAVRAGRVGGRVADVGLLLVALLLGVAHAGDSFSGGHRLARPGWPGWRCPRPPASRPGPRRRRRPGSPRATGPGWWARRAASSVDGVDAAGVGLAGLDLGLGHGAEVVVAHRVLLRKGRDQAGVKPNVLYAVVVPARSASNTDRSCGTTGSGRSSSGHQRSSAHFSRLDDPRLAGPGAGGEEEVDPLVDRLAAAGALHRGHERQVEVGHADLLQRLAPRGVVRRLALLDVPGRGRGPVVVHVAGVLPQLQQHLGAGDAVAQQEDVRRRHDDEPVLRAAHSSSVVGDLEVVRRRLRLALDVVDGAGLVGDGGLPLVGLVLLGVRLVLELLGRLRGSSSSGTSFISLVISLIS